MSQVPHRPVEIYLFCDGLRKPALAVHHATIKDGEQQPFPFKQYCQEMHLASNVVNTFLLPEKRFNRIVYLGKQSVIKISGYLYLAFYPVIQALPHVIENVFQAESKASPGFSLEKSDG